MLGGHNFLLKDTLLPLLNNNFLLGNIELVSDLILQVLALLKTELKVSNNTLRVLNLCLQLANLLKMTKLVNNFVLNLKWKLLLLDETASAWKYQFAQQRFGERHSFPR